MKLTTIFIALITLLLGASALTIPQSQSSSSAPNSSPEELAKVKREPVPVPVSGNCPNGNCGTVPIAEFHIYTGPECQKQDYYGHYFYYKGQDSDSCNLLVGHAKTHISSVRQSFGNFKCQLTVYMTTDCSDQGMAIGAPQPSATPGCFSHEENGGIMAFKVQCPWWDS